MKAAKKLYTYWMSSVWQGKSSSFRCNNATSWLFWASSCSRFYRSEKWDPITATINYQPRCLLLNITKNLNKLTSLNHLPDRNKIWLTVRRDIHFWRSALKAASTSARCSSSSATECAGSCSCLISVTNSARFFRQLARNWYSLSSKSCEKNKNFSKGSYSTLYL